MKEKLVRDNIPEIIKRNDGVEPKVRLVSKEEIVPLLQQKLQEEVNEFNESTSPEELADIMEVVLALRDFLGIEQEEFDRIREEKRVKNGGFEKGFVLEIEES